MTAVASPGDALHAGPHAVIEPSPPGETALARVLPAVERVRLHISSRNTPVVIDRVPSPLRTVGFGTDAVAVQHPDLPDIVFKVYAPEKLRGLDDELESYRRLAGSRFFPDCHGRGRSHLVLSYEHGPTLLECLLRGIPIPPTAVDDVESARREARDVGLYPKDIHLKNVILQAAGAKILDLSKYVVPGEDAVWGYLARGYPTLYPLVRGRPVPPALIEMVKKLYRARSADASVDQFLASLTRSRWPRSLVGGTPPPAER